MNRKILALAAFLFAASIYEGHSLGIGVQFGGLYYSGSAGGNASLLVSPTKTLHFAIDWYLNSGYTQLGGSVDYWFYKATLFDPLSFYVGAGIGAWVGLGDEMFLGVSPRLPIGLDCEVGPFDIFLQVVPQFGIGLMPSFGVGGIRVGGNLGIRFWF